MMQTRRRRKGFSLVEVAAAMVPLAFLSMAVASSIYLSSQSLKSATFAVQERAAASGASQLQDDLRVAKTVNVSAPNQVTMTVADRTGDGADETIAYSWTGPAGPLLRSMNGGSQIPAIESLWSFALTKVVQQIPSNPQTPPPVVVSSYVANVTLFTASINTLNLAAQAFTPTLPSGATSWTPTKCRFAARNDSGTTGTMSIQIQTQNVFGHPSGTILADASIDASQLSTSSYEWEEVAFTTTQAINAGTALCLLFKRGTATNTLRIQQEGSSGAKDSLLSSSGGIFWTKYNNRALRHEIEGTYTVPDPGPTARLREVQLSLKPAANGAEEISGSVELLNRPVTTYP